MYENYGSHMILTVANENNRMQNDYPAYACGNTGTN